MARNILIVEDEDHAMTPFHELLGAHGYDTLRANHADEAFDLARSHQPHLIMIELTRPDRTRLDLVRRIRSDSSLKAIPLVAITERSTPAEGAQLRSNGYDAHLTKPISVTRFVETLKTFLH